MQRSDWLLVFLVADFGDPLDPVRVQKGMFLLAMTEMLAPDECYEFEPYAYGPMSRRLYRDVRALCRDGLVVATPVAGASWQFLQATAAGTRRAREVQSQAQRERPDAIAEIGSIRRRVSGLDFSQLLRYVYDRHPEYAVRSVFRSTP